MAYLIGDGFDCYSGLAPGEPSSDAGAGGGWNTSEVAFSNVTRFGTGQAVDSVSQLLKTGGPNSATWWANAAMYQENVLGSPLDTVRFQFLDGASPQVTVTWRTDGSIQVHTGGVFGTVVATFTGAFVGLSYDHWQCMVIIHNTAGEVHLRKNGAASDTFAATGLNTRGGTTNNYANAFQLAAGFTGTDIDDLLVFDSSGSAPNSWVGDVRAIQLPAQFDTAQKQFTQHSSASLANAFLVGTSTAACNADTLYVAGNPYPIKPAQGGNLTTVTAVFNAGFAGKAKIALYAFDGDLTTFLSDSKPGRIVAVSDEVINPSASQVFNFSGTVALLTGWHYAAAILTNAAFTMKGQASAQNVYTTGISYAGGFPASLIGVVPDTSQSGSGFNWTFTLTATNAGCVSDYHEDGSTTYLSDATVGDYDLYDLADLPYNPAAIIGITARSFVAKTDAGARGVELALKSGGTVYLTSEYHPLTTYSNFNTFYPNDPATSGPWTAIGVNSLQAGPKVSS